MLSVLQKIRFPACGQGPHQSANDLQGQVVVLSFRYCFPISGAVESDAKEKPFNFGTKRGSSPHCFAAVFAGRWITIFQREDLVERG